MFYIKTIDVAIQTPFARLSKRFERQMRHLLHRYNDDINSYVKENRFLSHLTQHSNQKKMRTKLNLSFDSMALALVKHEIKFWKHFIEQK